MDQSQLSSYQVIKLSVSSGKLTGRGRWKKTQVVAFGWWKGGRVEGWKAMQFRS